jgi:hypothetical protein
MHAQTSRAKSAAAVRGGYSGSSLSLSYPLSSALLRDLSDHFGDGGEALERGGVGRRLSRLALNVGVGAHIKQNAHALGVAPVGAVVQRRPSELVQGHRQVGTYPQFLCALELKDLVP